MGKRLISNGPRGRCSEAELAKEACQHSQSVNDFCLNLFHFFSFCFFISCLCFFILFEQIRVNKHELVILVFVLTLKQKNTFKKTGLEKHKQINA